MKSDTSHTSTQQPVDSLFNYELHEEIGRGVTSIVFRGTCRRGRLRNRLVAVKKIASPYHEDTPSIKNLILATSLHSALCHPSIVSLISSFTAPSGFYQVLELCEKGTLADFLSSRKPNVLSEDELRGAARTLVDALIYLKKERVLHRDIKPNNILIVGNSRLKLSGFGSAVRLPTVNSVETTFCGSANYISPEILCGLPYSFAADMWSLGCVLATCLAGQPAFHASTPERIFDRICGVKYTLPHTVSYEARDLISGFLQKKPQDRTPLHRILSHPFFKPSLPTDPLSASKNSTVTLSQPDPSPRHDSTHATSSQRHSSSYSTHTARFRRPSPPEPVLKFSRQFTFKRTPLEDITNLYQDQPRDDVDLTLPAPPVPSGYASLRSVSEAHSGNNIDPTDSRPLTPALTADSGTPSVPSVATPQAVPVKETPRSCDFFSALPRSRRGISGPRGSGALLSADDAPQLHATGTVIPRIVSQASSDTVVSRAGYPDVLAQHFARAHRNLAHVSGNSILGRFSTLQLKPQTHKVSRGQLVVLPSRSLLVDFRESERRKGRSGKEVMTISPNGESVQVFDAPHLSTPCCLVEPAATYARSELPPKYAKLYDDAAHLVDQLNSRIPKLIHFWDDTKGTLMANGPPGDVEIVLSADRSREIGQGDMRLRLRRGKFILEISRHISKSSGVLGNVGEWSRKTIPLDHSFVLSEDDWSTLDGLERFGIARVQDFLRVCEAAEAIEAGGATKVAVDNGGEDGRARLKGALRHVDVRSTVGSPDERTRPISGSRPGSCASLPVAPPLVVVPPRPRKFSSTTILR